MLMLKTPSVILLLFIILNIIMLKDIMLIAITVNAQC